ncbi:hypothetical protein RRG08_032565 [Elysia crispata]|uniref:Uncharacterized protein n=1 Tax=Elysia crispata TaxID=231223 RepID=A0AAE0ZZF5_9GAST|nr:hypothetical protein RRG08_032565 [Elysia crispata]
MLEFDHEINRGTQTSVFLLCGGCREAVRESKTHLSPGGGSRGSRPVVKYSETVLLDIVEVGLLGCELTQNSAVRVGADGDREWCLGSGDDALRVAPLGGWKPLPGEKGWRSMGRNK